MKITLTSIFVNDQEKALAFYTGKLGFIKKQDIPMGEFRWISVVAPEGDNDVELVLEPNDNQAAKTFQSALFEQGIPLTAFQVDDINLEYSRLIAFGIEFKMAPMEAGVVKLAIFNDTCGNWIQIYQMIV